jgi:hypothetical protein
MSLEDTVAAITPGWPRDHPAPVHAGRRPIQPYMLRRLLEHHHVDGIG